MFLANDCGLKNAADVDTSDLASLKSDFEKLGINESEKSPRALNTLKSKVVYLDAGKLKTVSKDLKEISNVVAIEKSNYNADKIDLDKKMENVKNNLPDFNGIVINTTFNTEIVGIEKKIPNQDEYITTQEVVKNYINILLLKKLLTTEHFPLRLRKSKFSKKK